MAIPPVTLTFVIDESQLESFIDSRIMKLSPMAMGVFMTGEVTEYLEERVANRFANAGDSATGSWAPISPITLYNRVANQSPDPQIDTGSLRDWATDPGSKVLPTGNGYALDFPSVPPSDSITNYKYLMAQFGINNTFGRPGMRTPARPIFAADRFDLSMIMMLLFNHFMDD